MDRHVGRVRRWARAGLLASAALLLAGCGGDAGQTPSSPSPGIPPSTSAPTNPAGSPTGSPTGSPSPDESAGPTAPGRPKPSERPVAGSVPPAWLGTRVLPRTAEGFGEVRRTPEQLVQRRFTLPDQLPALPGRGFAVRVTAPAPADVINRSTWRPGCPVAAADLSWVRLTFHGFAGARHTGELLVNRSATDDLVGVFRRLYAARFPIEEMRITRRDELDAPPTGDGNNTGAFACRPTTGGTSYSQHAYGLGVDVNPFQNPYVNGDLVLPELASSFLDRGWVRPGMITADGPVTRAFDEIGWTWGGSWRSLKDLQHFSENGR